MAVKQYNTTAVFAAACAGMAFFGVAMLSLGPILGKLGAMVGDGANTLPSTLSIGIILGTVVFGPVVDKFGYKGLLITASVLALAGLQGLLQSLRVFYDAASFRAVDQRLFVTGAEGERVYGRLRRRVRAGTQSSRRFFRQPYRF